MRQEREQGRCPNRNHGRSNAPVRCCPDCGEVVNEKISAKHCAASTHDQSRRLGSHYCIDCGELLRR